MTLRGHIGLMAEEEEVVDDGMIGEMRRKDATIEDLNKTVTGLDKIIDDNQHEYEETIKRMSGNQSKALLKKEEEILGLRAEMDQERRVHQLEQENLALRAEVALQQQGQSQTPILDGLTRFGRELNELDDRASRRPPIEGQYQEQK